MNSIGGNSRNARAFVTYGGPRSNHGKPPKFKRVNIKAAASAVPLYSENANDNAYQL